MKKLAAVAVIAACALSAVGTVSAHASSNCWSSVRGCVSVHGYTKKNGTYVSPYYRSYPRPWSYSYRPSYSSSYSYRPSYSAGDWALDYVLSH